MHTLAGTGLYDFGARNGAFELLDPLTDRLPRLRRALALTAAAHAVAYDNEAMQAALDRYELLSPGSAGAQE